MKYEHRFRLQKAAPSFRVYAADGVSMRLDFFPDMLRVALLREGIPLLPTWSVWPLPGDCPLEGRDKLSVEGLETAEPEVTENEAELRFRLAGLDFTVEKKNFRITARNEKGLLYADRSGLAYNFSGELGDGSVHYTRREPGERSAASPWTPWTPWAFVPGAAIPSISRSPSISAKTAPAPMGCTTTATPTAG